MGVTLTFWGERELRLGSGKKVLNIFNIFNMNLALHINLCIQTVRLCSVKSTRWLETRSDAAQNSIKLCLQAAIVSSLRRVMTCQFL